MANVQEDNMLTANQQRALDLLLRLKHEFDPSHLSEACRELTGLIVNQCKFQGFLCNVVFKRDSKVKFSILIYLFSKSPK